MRIIVLLASLAVAPAALAQAGDGAAHAVHAVGSCCASCSAGACSVDSAGSGGCCAGMHGAAHGTEGAAGGMACCAAMHGDAAGHGTADHGAHAAMHGPRTHGAAETPEHEAVRHTINTLFDAMRAGDGEALLRQFHEGATLTSVGAGPDGVIAARREGIEGFAEAVGTPHPEPYDERVGPIEVRVDGPLATAWMTYRFHVGERFSHCGVNAFQLADTGDGWKILAVTDTRRPECVAEGQ